MSATNKLQTLKNEIKDLYYWIESYNDAITEIIEFVEGLEKKINEIEISDTGKQELSMLLDQWTMLLTVLLRETIIKKMNTKLTQVMKND